MSNPFYKNHSPFKVSEIFKFLNIKFDNVILDKEVLDIKDLLNANNNEITFLHSKKYSHVSKNTKASFCITTNSLKQYLPRNCIPVIVDNVLVATSIVTSKFYPDAVNDDFDNTAIDINETKFKEKVRYGKNVLIGSNVSIGSNCSIGHNTIIEKNVSIGNNCSIGSNTIIRNTVI